MQREGVVKFKLDYTPGPPLSPRILAELNAWRRILFLTQLVGENPHRYGGYGYGNVSMRLEQGSGCGQTCFAISGTQTGGLEELAPQHYAIVEECWPDENRVVATGPIKPSSESLTHGMIYNLDAQVRYVFHVHSADIWQQARGLGIPVTCTEAAYGTPAMAAEVRRLLGNAEVRRGMIFAMGGHEHGVVTFSLCACDAGSVMMKFLARALASSLA